MQNHPLGISKRTSLRLQIPSRPKKPSLKLGILLMGVSSLSQAASPIAGSLTDLPGLNATQTNMASVIEVVCPQGPKPEGPNTQAFQDRCNAMVGAAQSGSSAAAVGALKETAPEQMIGQGTGATRTSFNVIGGRLAALRAGVRGFQVAGFNTGSQPQTKLASQSLHGETGGSAGETGTDLWTRLGGFVNGTYNTGNLDSSSTQTGYNFNSGNTTIGLDYRLTKDLILGTAFTYVRSEASFNLNGGSLNSNAYTGAVYGTYYATEELYFEGITTFGGINYESTRNIQYSVPGDNVNTQATANPNGNQYSVSLGSGYNFALQEWTLNPYARVNYLKFDVDSFNENGGNGWAMGFSDQSVESVTTTLGSQISYAFSTSFGVFLPSIRGEWTHQYKDNIRNIAGRFLGSSPINFNTVTQAPDRNYFTVGTGVSGTFARGVSAFLNYDALVGYRDITSHLVTLGARVEF